jgi:Ca-activated chloride channel family protein
MKSGRHRSHYCFSLIALIACIWLSSAAAKAQGIIVPEACRRCPSPFPPPPDFHLPPSLQLRQTHIKSRITDQVATTQVTQTFYNPTPYTLEGVYFFPLPESASITDFAMWEGNRRLAGEVRSRDEARRIYNEIVRARRDPALLEYAGKNLFQVSIFPIAPHSDKKIELTYTQVLRNDHGTVAYRYPLGTGWRAHTFADDRWPRPLPEPGPPRDTLQPSLRPAGLAPAHISAEIEISSRIALKGIYSPSHEIAVKRDGERHARVSFELQSTAAQPDFQLFYTISEQDFGLSLITHREPAKDGYFMLLVSPKAELEGQEVSAKDIIFVLDTSGSMSEDGKIEKAKAALRFGVSALTHLDRFNIVSFAGGEHLLSAELIAANDDGKRQAREFIERMRASGGTNINDALLQALRQFQTNERPKIIVFITDGQPTVGVIDASRIMQNVKQANQTHARIFAFGVGYEINTLLLDGLAAENRGAADYIEPNEDIEVKVSNFFAKVNHPVLSEIRIDWGGVTTEMIYPREIPDLFHGSQLVLIGRYRSESGKSSPSRRLTLTGKVNGREHRFIYDDLQFPEVRTENEFLAQLWATRRVGFLIEQIRLRGDSHQLREEIIELCTRYGIVTPYTSSLILEPGMQAQRPSDLRAQNALAKLAPGAVAGEAAVRASKEKAKLLEADKLGKLDEARGTSGSQIRIVAGKIFYLRDGVWTDNEFKAGARLPDVTLKFASDDYFNLIGQEPKLAEFFALGKRVAVVWKGRLYRVEE